MIAAIEGIVEQRHNDFAVINVGGVSLQVYVSGSTLGQLGAPGERARLHTHLHWKEDSIALYGFVSRQELDLFKALMTVNGVGPKLALTILSGMDHEQVALAIASGNVDLLAQLPGVGKKMASRLVLELKGKLEKEWTAAGTYLTGDNAEVTAALTSLGYSAAEAAKAVAKLPRSPDLSTEDKVRLALRYLAG